MTAHMTAHLLPLACATCVGQEDQVTTVAANGAVYVMLACLALVGGGVVAVIIAFARRARRFAAGQDRA